VFVFWDALALTLANRQPEPVKEGERLDKIHEILRIRCPRRFYLRLGQE
jgi:hypothetical protein